MVSTQNAQTSTTAVAETGEIDRRVIDIIQEVLGLDEPPPSEMSLVEDLSVSSMDTMTLVLTLEEEFDEQIDEDAVESLRTVGDVIDLVRAQIRAGQAGLEAAAGLDEALE